MDATPTPPSPRLPRAAWLVTLTSGAAGLVFELVWVRRLALALGSTAPALAWIFAAFFAGLTLGAAAGARWRLAPARALRAYVLAELVVAAAGFAAGEAIGWGSRSAAPWVPWLPFAILPATFAMGLTLPLLCRAVGAAPGQASRIYVVNTLGGALGAGAAGYLTLELLGTPETLLLAAGLDVLAAAGAWAFVKPTAAGEAAPAAAAEERAPSRWTTALLAFGIGLGALSGEVVLNRLLYQVLGGTTYAVTTTLCVYLVAMAAGAWLAARPWLRPAHLPAVLLTFAAASALAPVVLSRSAEILRSIAATTELDTRRGFGLGLAAAAAVLAPPAFASGVAFPLLVRRHGRSGAESLGFVYAVNTFGAIAGSLLTTFVLVPRFGTTTTATAMGGVAALLAAAAATPRARAGVLTAGAVLTAIGLYSAPAPEGLRLWLYDELAADPQAFEDAAPPSGAAEVERAVVYVEGVGASAGVYERRRGARVALDFAINGKKEASTDFEALRNQLVLGHLPMLLHPEPRQALVVGLGAGVTAGAVALHPGVSVVVAELSPEVPTATRGFAGANHGVLDRPNVRVVFEDGRRYLVKYSQELRDGLVAGLDVITSDPIHPWVSGAANLYTRDYFELVASSLSPRGVAAHWLPLYEMGVDESLAIVRGFADAFPECALWVTFAGDAVLVGCKAPLRVDLDRFAARAAGAGVRDDLEGIRLDDPLRLLAGFAVGPRALDGSAAAAVTDDRQTLEFRAARNIFLPTTVGPNLTYFASKAWDVDSLARFLGLDGARGRARLAALLEANRSLTRAVGAILERRLDAADLALDAWAREPDGEQLAPLLRAPGLAARLAKPSTAAEALVAGAAHARGARRLARPADLPGELRASVRILESALHFPGLDAAIDRAVRRQIAVLEGELRAYARGLDVLEPLLRSPDVDPTILRIAARLLEKLDRGAEARALLDRAALEDFRK